MPAELVKTCTTCGKTQPETWFGKDPRYKSGRRPQCLTCRRTPAVKASHAARSRVRRVTHVEVRNRSAQRREKTTGWTKAAFDAAWARQHGCCAICQVLMLAQGWAKNAVCADHCARTNKTRELLCRRCNAALGLFDHSTIVLRRAAQYVATHANNLSSAEDFCAYS